MTVWIGVILALAALIYLSRYSLPLGMGISAIILSVFTLSLSGIGEAFVHTFADPSVLLLAFVVGVIPMIGGVLEESGGIDRLVGNLRIGVQPFLALSPALLGMLPMPGGALLSAPLVERGAPDVPADVKAAANVWFRHAFLLVYPLGTSLIASAKIASLGLYTAILYLLPAFFLVIGLGYLFLLRKAHGKASYNERFSGRELAIPLLIILAAPLIDLVLKKTLPLPYPEIGTAVGVTVSLALGVAFSRSGLKDLLAIYRKMRPHYYAGIIFAMFFFLRVFEASGAPERIAALSLPPIVLCVVIGFLLGLITGRIQTPISIVVPIYLTTHVAVSGPAFAVTYFAIYLGYLISPIHPCVSVSLEYFSVAMPVFLKRMAVPVAIAFLADLGMAWFVL
jgi:integral membrane protein (TIGR00529 family)